VRSTLNLLKEKRLKKDYSRTSMTLQAGKLLPIKPSRKTVFSLTTPPICIFIDRKGEK
jgi:hypothetical protein